MYSLAPFVPGSVCVVGTTDLRATVWEILMWVDSEAAARVSGAAETVDYFG